ncbi:MAG: hypothetical protein R3Y05_03935 [bacterium]
MKVKNIIVPFIIVICLLTIKFSNTNLFNNIKDNFTKEIDIITLSKEFLGKFQFIYFKENDYNVSSNDVVTKLDDNLYFIQTETNELINKTEGIVYSIIKKDGLYTIKVRSENMIITYYDLVEPTVYLYQYIKQGDIISKINYNYTVSYES